MFLSFLFIAWIGKKQLALFLVIVLVNFGFGILLGETRKNKGFEKTSQSNG